MNIVPATIRLTFFAMLVACFNIQAEGQVVEKLNDNNGNIYRVIAPSSLLEKKAMISLHSALLEKEKDALFFELNAQQIAKLVRLGFVVQPAPDWQANWNKRQHSIRKQAISVAQYKSQNNSQTKSLTGIAGYSCYATVEETYAAAEDLASRYPTLSAWIDIGDSWEKSVGMSGYDIKVLKITNQQVVKQKPILFIQSAMHAREYTPAALSLDFATELLENYSKEANAQWLIDQHEIHIVFQLNPDGRKHAENGILWRKNTNVAYCGANSSERGVDLNRNFSFTWAESVNGSSNNQCALDYRGPFAASEPEVQSIENYLRSIYPDRRGTGLSDPAPLDIQGIHLDIHSFSELILWPWGHIEAKAPNDQQLERLGRKLAYWNQYTPMQSIGLYPTDGTSESISYGELGVPQITFELGNSFFEPCDNYLNTIRPDNLPALYYAAKAVAAPFQLPFGPEIIDLKLNGNSNAQIQAGEPLLITGVAKDGLYNSVGSTIEAQNITKVNLFVDLAPWETGAVAISLDAADGLFNASDEGFSSQIDTANMLEGRHLIYVQATDATHQVGVLNAAFVMVGNASNSPPEASFVSSCVNANCTFDAVLSSDDSMISLYLWDFGDLSADEGKLVSKSYQSEGVFTVILTVTDDYGLQSTISEQLTVQARPTATFSVGCSHLICSFNAENSADLSGEIVSYNWSISDNSSYSTAITNHTFASSGGYSITLTVVDDEGESDSLTRTISVIAKPEVIPQQSSGGGSFSYLLIIILLIMLIGEKTQLSGFKKRW